MAIDGFGGFDSEQVRRTEDDDRDFESESQEAQPRCKSGMHVPDGRRVNPAESFRAFVEGQAITGSQFRFLKGVRKSRINRYILANQRRFPDGIAVVHRYLRQFYTEDQVTYRKEGNEHVLETLVSFDEAELGYLQAIHDFGLPSIVAPLRPIEDSDIVGVPESDEEESEWD